MEPTNSLSSFYNALKGEISPEAPAVVHLNPDMYRHKVKKHCDALKDKCLKHFILDMYCKILPLDDDYKCGNMGQMKGDIDGMLAAKGMTPTQYFTSCFESTNAPFLKYLIDASNTIAHQYYEAEEEKLKDAQENDISIPDPIEPETDDPEVNSQLVDVSNDMEYETFVDALKKKTIDKIVSDVSDIINNEKKDEDMKFDPVGESAVGTAMDYLQKKLYNENVDTETMLGMAIREATLFEFDKVFKQGGLNPFKEYTTRVRLGKGYVINESALSNK